MIKLHTHVHAARTSSTNFGMGKLAHTHMHIAHASSKKFDISALAPAGG